MRFTPTVLCRLISVAATAVAAAGCGDVIRSTRSPVVLVVDSMTGISGNPAVSSGAANTLLSDVIVFLTTPEPCTPTSPCPTIYSDSGQVRFHLEPKNITIEPSSNNQVTINRYRVAYRRLDGRNTPGVDVPYGFDGAITGTVPPSGTATFGFELVRHVAKEESPLVQLVVNPNIILTVADVTFFGTDLVGNAVSATASLSVEFGNFGDR